MRSALLLLVLAGACRSALAAGQPALSHDAVPVVHLRDGARAFSEYSGLVDSARFVVRDSTRWQEVWQRINRPFYPPPRLPPVDFQRHMVIVAALGNRPSGGYDILIEDAAEDSAGVEVGVRITRPGNGCITPAVLTQPVDLAAIPRTSRAVRFREHEVVATCSVR